MHHQFYVRLYGDTDKGGGDDDGDGGNGDGGDDGDDGGGGDDDDKPNVCPARTGCRVLR